MWRFAPLLVLLLVAACDRQPVVLEPEAIDVCPVVAQQIENLLVEIVEFVETATTEELTEGSTAADELTTRGVQLSQRAIDLQCDPGEVRAQISADRLDTDDPIAGQFVDLVLAGLEQ